MRLLDLIEAVDVDKTYLQLGNRLHDRLSDDPSFQNDPDETTIKGFINHAINVDPSRNQSYTLWIIRTYLKGGIRRYEDFSRLQMALNLFNKFKSKLSIKDIGQIKSLSQLEQLVDEVKDKQEPISGKAQQRAYKQEILNQSQIVYQGQDGMIVIPETEEASIFWGRGTRWCTAATDSENYFDHYSKTGPLYVIIHNGTKLQLHVESSQFLNDQDEKITQDDYREFEAAKWAATKLPFEKWIMGGFIELIQFIPNPSEAFYLAAVSQNGEAIKYIKTPSEKVKLAAVSQNGYVIQFIDKPSEQVQLAAVSQNGAPLAYIRNPSEQVQLAAVSQYGNAIYDIKTPSEKVKLAAVSQNGNAIKYIKTPSEKVKLAAVSQNGEAIKFIDNPSEQVQLAAVSQNGEAIGEIKTPTPTVRAYVDSHSSA